MVGLPGRGLSLVARGHGVGQHLAHRVPVQPKLSGDLPYAHPLHHHRPANPQINVHLIHPSHIHGSATTLWMMAVSTVFSRRYSAILRPRGPLYPRRLHADLALVEASRLFRREWSGAASTGLLHGLSSSEKWRRSRDRLSQAREVCHESFVLLMALSLFAITVACQGDGATVEGPADTPTPSATVDPVPTSTPQPTLTSRPSAKPSPTPEPVQRRHLHLYRLRHHGPPCRL